MSYDIVRLVKISISTISELILFLQIWWTEFNQWKQTVRLDVEAVLCYLLATWSWQSDRWNGRGEEIIIQCKNKAKMILCHEVNKPQPSKKWLQTFLFHLGRGTNAVAWLHTGRVIGKTWNFLLSLSDVFSSTVIIMTSNLFFRAVKLNNILTIVLPAEITMTKRRMIQCPG